MYWLRRHPNDSGDIHSKMASNEEDGLIYTLTLLRGEFPLGWKGVYSCQAGFTKETDLVHWEQEMTWWYRRPIVKLWVPGRKRWKNCSTQISDPWGWAKYTFSAFSTMTGTEGWFSEFCWLEWHLDIISMPGEEGNGTPLQYSCLENPTGEGAW